MNKCWERTESDFITEKIFTKIPSSTLNWVLKDPCGLLIYLGCFTSEKLEIKTSKSQQDTSLNLPVLFLFWIPLLKYYVSHYCSVGPLHTVLDQHQLQYQVFLTKEEVSINITIRTNKQLITV